MIANIIMKENFENFIIFREVIIATLGDIDKAIDTFKRLQVKNEENLYIELIIIYLRNPCMFYYIREKSKTYNKCRLRSRSKYKR